MTTVNELKRKTKTGYSLYLDYRINGKRIQERTGLQLIEGKDTVTRQHNKEVMIRFKYIVTEKQKQIMDGIANVPLTVKRQRIDFFEYFEKYMVLNPSKERRGTATLKKMKRFANAEVLPISTITEPYLLRFKNYLESSLTGETPYHYFKYLKMVLKQATKDKLFATNPAADIKVPCIGNEPKNGLTVDELRVLVKTDCPNETVKRAFLFSSLTGLRFCDIKLLCWRNIKGDVLQLIQAKTNHPVTVRLVDFALKLLGERGDDVDMVFELPTNNGCNKSIKKWVVDAGIDKKITYHCARHSYATNLYNSGADIYMTSAALGHKSLKETPRYVRLAQSTVNEAILKMKPII